MGRGATAEREKFRVTFERAPVGIAEATVDGRFTEGNARLVEILGYTKDEIAPPDARRRDAPELKRTARPILRS